MIKDDDDPTLIKVKFNIYGIVVSPSFQRCRNVATKMYKSFPKRFEKPVIKPMLNVEWEQHLTRMKRTIGDGIWSLQKPVMVFKDDTYLGDDRDFIKHLQGTYHYSINLDLFEEGRCHLVDMLRDIIGKYRQIAYLTIAINNQVIGSLMFELYNDLVPLACENFLEKCREPDGYRGAPIHRIVKNSWIQCGGWNLKNKQMPCENYVVPHDRRGVLCTTNVGRHKENTTQFFITLAPTPWMDTKYVAFGQLLQGEEVLRTIERVPTYYESPKWPVNIVMSGEVTLDGVPDYFTSTQRAEFDSLLPFNFLDKLDPESEYNVIPTTSKFSMTKFKKGLYGMETDMRNYLAYLHLPKYLMPWTYRIGGSEGAPSISSSDDDTYTDVLHDQSLLGSSWVNDFSKTQEILKDCTFPTVSQTTI